MSEADDTVATILVVDDDEEILDLIGKYLAKEGFRALSARDEQEMRRALAIGKIDLVVLDVMLPRISGFDLCRELRAQSGLPILMLTAKDDVVDRVLGLELGADDYLTKPFNPRELVARIRAILRRTSPTADPTGRPAGAVVRFANWTFDTRRRELSSPEGVIVDLSNAEFDLLMAFVEHPQEVLSRENLLELTGNRPEVAFDRTIDVQISRLRRKFEIDEGQPPLIKTIRGAGYFFIHPVTRP